MNDRETDAEFRYQEAIQLHRTIQAFQTTVINEAEELRERMDDAIADLPLFTAIALSYSTLLSLYDAYSCVENVESRHMGCAGLLEMQRLAISGLKEISGSVLRFSQRIETVAELGGTSRMTPLVGDCLYQAAANYSWYANETGSRNELSKATEIKNVLERLGGRWKSASKC
jgi:hypothetical protein